VIEKSTGRLVARDDEHIGPDIFHSTWSSPALGEVNGHPRVFFCGGNGIVYGFEPLKSAPPAGQVAKLTKIWQFDPDPGAPKENIHDYLRNREVSPSNMHGMPVFAAKRLYFALGGDLWWGKNQAWLKCVDATGSGDVTKSALIWSYALEQHVMATPAIWHGLVFAADCGHKVHCVDVVTGKPLWTHDTGAEVWASPLVADGKVYFATRKGEVFVFAADKEKTLLSQASLGDASSSTPIAANGTLYFATMKNLYAVASGAQLPVPERKD
jgi:outer membrane protein assembly factor BamB